MSRNFKRTINCPKTQANVSIVRSMSVEPELKELWMAKARAKSFRSLSLKFGFRIHRASLWGKRAIQIIQCFF